MRLAQFILTHRATILDAWDTFAGSLMPGNREMWPKELRDHAEEMLLEIAADMGTLQSAQESAEKSQGHGPRCMSDTASEVHAGARLRSGLSVEQLVAEYRALRASVFLLWSEARGTDDEFLTEDTLRFNEAIDQGLAESVARYSQAVNESQDVFLGVLGHDLRSPLSAILLSAEFFRNASEQGSRHAKVAEGISTSVRRAEKIVEDLLDFVRARVGNGIPVDRVDGDLNALCESIVHEASLAHPDRAVVFEPDGSIVGKFDNARLGQVFSNLIENAIKHGSPGSPVVITQRREGELAVFSIHNQGDPIAAEDRARIFNPMVRHSQFAKAERGPRAGLGLGLFVAQEIVTAHGGTIDVASSEESGTMFSVSLPLQ